LKEGKKLVVSPVKVSSYEVTKASGEKVTREVASSGGKTRVRDTSEGQVQKATYITPVAKTTYTTQAQQVQANVPNQNIDLSRDWNAYRYIQERTKEGLQYAKEGITARELVEAYNKPESQKRIEKFYSDVQSKRLYPSQVAEVGSYGTVARYKSQKPTFSEFVTQPGAEDRILAGLVMANPLGIVSAGAKASGKDYVTPTRAEALRVARTSRASLIKDIESVKNPYGKISSLSPVGYLGFEIGRQTLKQYTTTPFSSAVTDIGLVGGAGLLGVVGGAISKTAKPVTKVVSTAIASQTGSKGAIIRGVVKGTKIGAGTSLLAIPVQNVALAEDKKMALATEVRQAALFGFGVSEGYKYGYETFKPSQLVIKGKKGMATFRTERSSRPGERLSPKTRTTKQQESRGYFKSERVGAKKDVKYNPATGEFSKTYSYKELQRAGIQQKVGAELFPKEGVQFDLKVVQGRKGEYVKAVDLRKEYFAEMKELTIRRGAKFQEIITKSKINPKTVMETNIFTPTQKNVLYSREVPKYPQQNIVIYKDTGVKNIPSNTGKFTKIISRTKFEPKGVIDIKFKTGEPITGLKTISGVERPMSVGKRFKVNSFEKYPQFTVSGDRGSITLIQLNKKTQLAIFNERAVQGLRKPKGVSQLVNEPKYIGFQGKGKELLLNPELAKPGTVQLVLDTSVKGFRPTTGRKFVKLLETRKIIRELPGAEATSLYPARTKTPVLRPLKTSMEVGGYRADVPSIWERKSMEANLAVFGQQGQVSVPSNVGASQSKFVNAPGENMFSGLLAKKKVGGIVFVPEEGSGKVIDLFGYDTNTFGTSRIESAFGNLLFATKQIPDYKYLTIPKVGLKQQSLILKDVVTNKNFMIERPGLILDQRMNQIQQQSQVQTQQQVQAQVQTQELIQRQRTATKTDLLVTTLSSNIIKPVEPIRPIRPINEIVPREPIPRKPRPNEPIRPRPIVPDLLKPRALTPSNKKIISLGRSGAFGVLLKRRGRFVKIAGGLSKEAALDIGTRNVKRTLGATFKIVPEAGYATKTTSTGEFERYRNELRSYAIKKGQRVQLQDTFIQLRSKRLGSTGERSEIKQSRIGKSFFKTSKGGVMI
jgi:hypothetical protein